MTFPCVTPSQGVPSFGITRFPQQGPAPVGQPWVSSSMRSSRISPPGCWDFVPGFCVATASSSSSVLAALTDGFLPALPSCRAVGICPLPAGACPLLHRQRWLDGVCVCVRGVLQHIPSPFPTQVIKELPVLQAAAALLLLSEAALLSECCRHSWPGAASPDSSLPVVINNSAFPPSQ